jgi:hypothetical protein
MRVERPFRNLPDVEPTVVEALHDNHIMLAPHACEACGELTTGDVLCPECEDRVRPHRPDDPYDVLGGDDGAE